MKNIHYWNIRFLQNDFFILYSEEINESNQEFESASDFFNFLQTKKKVDFENIIFFAMKNGQKFYKSYKEIVLDKKWLELTLAIKLKRENKILWK